MNRLSPTADEPSQAIRDHAGGTPAGPADRRRLVCPALLGVCQIKPWNR